MRNNEASGFADANTGLKFLPMGAYANSQKDQLLEQQFPSEGANLLNSPYFTEIAQNNLTVNQTNSNEVSFAYPN